MSRQKAMADLTLFAGAARLPGGWRRDVRVAVRGGRIAAIATGAAAQPGDRHAACLIPGLPNLHSHAFQRAMAGLAEGRGAGDDGFWTWREVMYRFLDRLTPDDVAAIAALAYMEMLETGFTRVGEFHYLHHAPDGRGYDAPAEMAAAIARAAETSGIGLTLLPVFYAWSGFGARPPLPQQRRFVSDRDGFARLVEGSRAVVAPLRDAVVGIAPHSLRAAAPDDLPPLVALAGEAPIHIHVAEQQREVDDCLAWSGRRPVEWLLDHVDVGSHWCLVHATHVTPAEAGGIARAGAVVGLCPVTEANLGDGLFPAAAFRAAGGRFGVGSDSNVLIDATEELRLLEYGQRLSLRARNVLADGAGGATGAALHAGAVAGGAQALGVATGLAEGAAFDAVALDLSHPSLLGRRDDALLDALVFAAGRAGIDRVWRAGREWVSGGRHVARDAIRARYARVIGRLLA